MNPCTSQETVIKKNKLLFVLLSGLLTSIASASGLAPACHRLMTEKECTAHQTLLATLPHGAALNRYLSKYASIMLEREAACRKPHTMATGA